MAEGVAVEALLQAVARFSDNRLVAQGATALAVKLSNEAVQQILAQLPDNPTAQHLRDEIAWMVEC